MEDIKLAGFIFEPYNDGQIITKATWYKAYDLPDQDIQWYGCCHLDDPYESTTTFLDAILK